MRSHYLLKRSNSSNAGCRGGVRAPDGETFELEIGGNCFASPAMISIAAHADEIVDLLKKLMPTEPLAGLLLASIHATEDELVTDLANQEKGQ